jgi:hypothetical protein
MYHAWTGETADWIDRTLSVPTLNALTLDQWVDEFKRPEAGESGDHGQAR